MYKNLYFLIFCRLLDPLVFSTLKLSIQYKIQSSKILSFFKVLRYLEIGILYVFRYIFQDNLEAGRGTILGVIGLILFFVILLILCCACCNYCILKSAANRTKQDMAHVTGRTRCVLTRFFPLKQNYLTILDF